MANNTAAFGIFATIASAEAAVGRLQLAGFSNDDVSVLISDTEGLGAFASTMAPQAATTGVGVGGVVGGTLGFLAGICALAIPGMGPFIAAGPLMASLAGLSVGGAVGGLVGVLVGMGIPEYEAKQYDGRLKDGGVLLSVHCGSSEEITKVKDVFQASGAEDIASCVEEYSTSEG